MKGSLGETNETTQRRKRPFVIIKHTAGGIMDLGLLIDSGAGAHMVPEGMFELPVNTSGSFIFKTVDGTEMPSPGTQLIPAYIGETLMYPLLYNVISGMWAGSIYPLVYLEERE